MDEDYPELTWPMVEAVLDWDVERVNRLIVAGIPRESPEWRIAEGHVRQFYELMMKAR
jgi:hypothetical protein